MAPAYACRLGVPGSVVALNSVPSPPVWATLRGAGLSPATLGPRRRKTVRCPVNGDGYWYTVRDALDEAGGHVGTVRDDDGPGGPL